MVYFTTHKNIQANQINYRIYMDIENEKQKIEIYIKLRSILVPQKFHKPCLSVSMHVYTNNK